MKIWQKYMKKLYGRITKSNSRKGVWGIILLSLFVLLNIGLKMFVADVFRISGFSMYPTLQDGDYVLINKCCIGFRLPRNVFEVPWLNVLCYYCTSKSYVNNVLQSTSKKDFSRWGDFNPVKRGDVIAFNHPGLMREFVVKRCVGLPGDSIGEYLEGVHSPSITPFSVVPYKGMKIFERKLTLAEKEAMKRNRLFRYVEEDSVFVAKYDGYFVLGDNLKHSDDSRLWGILSEDLIVGKLEFVLKKSK